MPGDPISLHDPATTQHDTTRCLLLLHPSRLARITYSLAAVLCPLVHSTAQLFIVHAHRPYMLAHARMHSAAVSVGSRVCTCHCALLRA